MPLGTPPPNPLPPTPSHKGRGSLSRRGGLHSFIQVESAASRWSTRNDSGLDDNQSGWKCSNLHGCSAIGWRRKEFVSVRPMIGGQPCA